MCEVVVRDQRGERVGDPVEQAVEALLGEDLVEDVGEALVRLDELSGVRLGGRSERSGVPSSGGTSRTCDAAG